MEVLRQGQGSRGLGEIEIAYRGTGGLYYLWGRPFPARVCAGFTSASLEGSPWLDMPRVMAGIGVRAGIASMRQVHGSEVRTVGGPGTYQCDGIFSRSGSLALVVRTADCLPLVFYSAGESVSGVVHMGWRSADSGILQNTGFDLSSFVCVAGPGLRRCCYKVGEDFSRRNRIGPFVERRGGSHFFDPIAFSKAELQRCGLPAGAFYDSGICSLCSDRTLHSYRRTGSSHRTLTFIICGGGSRDA
jgi:copper oxidase (laccase) domain-containing protein